MAWNNSWKKGIDYPSYGEILMYIKKLFQVVIYYHGESPKEAI